SLTRPCKWQQRCSERRVRLWQHKCFPRKYLPIRKLLGRRRIQHDHAIGNRKHGFAEWRRFLILQSEPQRIGRRLSLHVVPAVGISAAGSDSIFEWIDLRHTYTGGNI